MFSRKSQKLLAAALVGLLVILAAVTTYNFIIFYGILTPREAKISRARAVIDRLYVDPVADQQLIDAAIKGMIQSLDDPHSQYLTGLENESLKDVTKGEYKGVGIKIESADGR